MPEFCVESLKDHRTCFKCKLTGKKSLLTCIKCHAITYCGVECQKADWERHHWNCVPVMVKEFPGKGRGIVAARDIKMGEEIFRDKPVIKLAMDAKGVPVDPEFMTSLKDQIEKLPAEAKLQYYKLTARGLQNIYNVSRSDFEIFKLFLHNAKTMGKDEYTAWLHLNCALVNHSCVPNSALGKLEPTELDGDQDLCDELRAIKDISKGEEITICYYNDVTEYGSMLRKRKTNIKKVQGFDCKCPVCLGQVSCQEKILKKLIELHNKLDPSSTNWKREADTRNKIVYWTMDLNIGGHGEKWNALFELAEFAHLARDKNLVTKAMDKMRQIAEDTKLEDVRKAYEKLEMRFFHWSKEFKLGNTPEEREIESILARLDTDVDDGMKMNIDEVD